MPGARSLLERFPHAAGACARKAHGDEYLAAGKQSCQSARREQKFPGAVGRQSRQGGSLECQVEKQGRAAEGSQTGVFHDFQPAFPGYFNGKPVSAVRYSVQVQAARDGYPAGTADNAADQGGEEQGCRPCQAARKPPHHQANQR